MRQINTLHDSNSLIEAMEKIRNKNDEESKFLFTLACFRNPILKSILLNSKIEVTESIFIEKFEQEG